ncbi:hypothetical protein [Phytohabitans suffuscus]|nr:hypothetical protein [Phytohabitans suffuscus]
MERTDSISSAEPRYGWPGRRHGTTRSPAPAIAWNCRTVSRLNRS